MNTIIKTDNTDLAGIIFIKENKDANWVDLTQEEQIKILNALSSYYLLYKNFIKPE